MILLNQCNFNEQVQKDQLVLKDLKVKNNQKSQHYWFGILDKFLKTQFHTGPQGEKGNRGHQGLNGMPGISGELKIKQYD